MLLIVHVVVPGSPAEGFVQVKTGPESCANETNVVPAGTSSVSCTFAAALGPEFVTITPNTACEPAAASKVRPPLLTPRSATGLSASITVKLVRACTVPPNGSYTIQRASPRLGVG